MNTKAEPSAILIAGPTASGKSAIAMEIAEAFDGVVINADAMQVYRDLRILTARPSLADERRVPHQLYGILGAEEACSAGRWLELIEPVLADARQNKLLPVVVGGTGLYFRALTEGMAPIPQIPAGIREEARALFERIGGAAFRKTLEQIDPESASTLPPTDRQRLIRAFEVATFTGQPLAAWHELPVSPLLADGSLRFVLLPEREELYGRIDTRFDTMLKNGALEEVKALSDRGLDPELPAMKALGVQELLRYLAEDTDLETAASAAKTASRRYAKRQRTWLKTQMMSWKALKTKEMEKFGDEIFTNICKSGLTPG